MTLVAWTGGGRTGLNPAQRAVEARLPYVRGIPPPGGELMSLPTAYEGEWDDYSLLWEEGAETASGRPRFLGDEWGGGHKARYTRFIRPHIRHDDVVLEIGPGGGRLTAELLRDCRMLIGLDVSTQMLERLARRFGSHPRLHLVKGNGLDLRPLQDASVDCAVSYDVFVHLEPEDVYSYLIEIRRVLRPGGRGLIHFSNLLSEAGFARFRANFIHFRGGHRRVGKFSCMTPSLMYRFLSSLGFEIRTIDDREFHSRDALAVFELPITG